MMSYARARRRAALALVALLAASACSSTTEPNTPSDLLTRLPRDLTPAEQQIIGAANGFSFALWHRIATVQHDSNVFISPLSASFALGMTLNGAAGQTFDEMRTALQIQGMSQADVNAGYKSLIALLLSLDPAVTMGVANSVWYRRDFPFNQSFLDDAKTWFDAEVQGLDFDDTAGSLGAINGWVDDRTNGKIPSIISAIDPADVMYLINALYFKGRWRARFDSTQTIDGTFTTRPGDTQPVRLMQRLDTMSYAEAPTWQAVDLPYGNGAFTMTVVLPRPGTDIDAFSETLTESSWRDLTSSFARTKIQLALPKFRLAYERLLNDDLDALGMHVPFVPGAADFTRMSPAGNELFISIVKQKAFVDVNEEGTEAAAVTVVGIYTTSVPAYPTMVVNRPFIFVIRERLSGTVLFMGKVVRMPS